MKVYAFKCLQDVLLKSSSGGAFTMIVNAAIKNCKQDYSIYGAAWDRELVVKHTRIDKIEDIDVLRGSKYVRSDLSSVFNLVEQDLNNELFVIFSGTPCQIFGLKTYLNNRNINAEKLLTIDIICHGTPKPVVWKDCKEWMERKLNHRIINVCFRDKSVGWKRYPTTLVLDNNKTVKWSYFSQIYIRMFFSLYTIEKGCFSCKFSNLNRISDITIGDFWGIENVIPQFNRDNGVSLVLSNSELGDRICCQIKNSSDYGLIEEYIGDYSNFLKYQHNLNRPTEKPELYDQFWNDYSSMSFNEIIKKYKFYTLKGRIRFMVKSLLLKFKYFENKLS